MCDGNTLKKKLSVDLISPKRQKKKEKKIIFDFDV